MNFFGFLRLWIWDSSKIRRPRLVASKNFFFQVTLPPQSLKYSVQLPDFLKTQPLVAGFVASPPLTFLPYASGSRSVNLKCFIDPSLKSTSKSGRIRGPWKLSLSFSLAEPKNFLSSWRPACMSRMRWDWPKSAKSLTLKAHPYL